MDSGGKLKVKSLPDASLASSSGNACGYASQEAARRRAERPQCFECEKLEIDLVTERRILGLLLFLRSSAAAAAAPSLQVAGRARVDSCRIPSHWHAARVGEHSFRRVAVASRQSASDRSAQESRPRQGPLEAGAGVDLCVLAMATCNAAAGKCVIAEWVELVPTNADARSCSDGADA